MRDDETLSQAHDANLEDDALFARLRRAYAADPSSVERVKRQGLAERAARPRAAAWAPRLAAALATDTTEATLTITNQGGFVTVSTGASQWIVLPGDDT